jgi:hypothetical protein
MILLNVICHERDCDCDVCVELLEVFSRLLFDATGARRETECQHIMISISVCQADAPSISQ